jgi:hypothetical protein
LNYNGGGIYINDGEGIINFSYNNFSNNSVGQGKIVKKFKETNGGAIYILETYSDLYFYWCRFENNTAYSYGGAINLLNMSSKSINFHFSYFSMNSVYSDTAA